MSSPNEIEEGDNLRVISVNEDGSLEIEVIKPKIKTVRVGPKWGPKPPKKIRNAD